MRCATRHHCRDRSSDDLGGVAIGQPWNSYSTTTSRNFPRLGSPYPTAVKTAAKRLNWSDEVLANRNLASFSSIYSFLDLLSLRLSLPCSETQSFNCFSISDKGLAKGSACEAWRDGTCRKSDRLDVGPGAHDYVDCRNVIVWLNSVETALRRGRSHRFARTRDLQDDGGDDFCDRPTTYPPNRLTSFEPLAASICWPVKSEPALNPIVMRFLTRRAACFSLE